MRRILKWIGIVVAALIAVIVLVIGALYTVTGMRLNRVYRIPPEAIAVPSDPGAIERGRHWASIRCAGCHGEDMAGSVVFEDPSLGRIESHNLTAGRGGDGGRYNDADWVRAIRHGVGPEGKPLLVMPAEALYYLSDADLGDIIAAGNIDHTGPRPAAPPPGISQAYGAYLVNTTGCRTCHGPDLSGAKPPNPNSLLAPNLTPGGPLRTSEATFITAMRTRDSPFMPFKDIGRMTDDELKALWLYLRSLPPKARGNR